MKNLFRIVMAVAVLFTASCAKEDVSSSIGGGEVEVTFTADLGQLGTRAYGEADNVDVVYLGVYEANSNAPLPLVDPAGYPVVDGQASITVVLLKDKVYDLVFWAQNKAQSCYNVVWDERKVTVNYDGVKSQDDARDAFFLVENDFRAGHDETIFKLYRPFAQLNAGLNAKDVEFIGKNGVEISKFKSQVVVKQVATTLNLLEEATDTALDVADFKDVTFALEAKPTQKLNVSGTDYEYLSMNYLLVDAKQNVDLTYTFVDGEGTEYLRPYFSVPVQRNYRTNILGQLISSPLDFNVIIVPDFIDPDNDLQGDTQTFNVSSQAEFEDALAKAATQDHIQHLVINLNADVTLDVTAWQTLAIGNKNTKDITINGSKSRAAEYYTLTFNNTNSDWNNVATNGAKLILESLNITNSGYGATDAPWNRHDINFACDVELNNVVSLNAIALKANAKIENTTINDDHTGSSYAVWIQPNGQTVTIDNCTIDSTGAGDGRGIKIDEQYVDAPKKVVLNVSNTEFVTESKAAIVVKSKAGAEINASNLNIAGVAADTVYAVWVDEDAAAYYNLVEITGAQVRLEGSAITTTQDELNAAVAAGGNITLPAGQYTFPTGIKAGTVIYCAEGVVFNGKSSLNINGATVNGGTFSNESDTAVGGTVNGNFKNCTFTGSNAFRYAYAGENCYFEDCVFDGAVYGFHFDGGANPATFVRCSFSGFNAFGSAVTLLTLKDCTFQSTGKSGYNGGNFWGKTVMENTTFIFDGQASTQWIGINNADGIALNNSKAVDANNNELSLFDYFANIDNGDKVTIDGVVYTLYEDGSYAANGEANINSSADLETVLASANDTTINLKAGEKYEAVVGELKNVTINGEGSVMIFKTDANTKLENVTLNGVKFEYTGATADCGVVIAENAQIENLVIDGCTVEGTGAKAGRGLSGKNPNATIVIKNTTFKNIGYPVYAWGGYKALTIEGCTFENIKSWAIMPQSGFDGDLTVNGCNFVDCLGGGLIKAGTLTAGHTFTFTNNTITGCTIAGDHNWFQFNVSAGTSVISGNTKDGVAWTPGAADGLK